MRAFFGQRVLLLIAAADAFLGPALPRASPSARTAPARACAPEEATPTSAAAPPPKKNKLAGSDPLIPDEPSLADWVRNAPFAMSKSLARQTLLSQTMEAEPLPKVWDLFWEYFPPLKPGHKGEPLTFGDVARTFKVNIEQIFGGVPAPDGAPLAAADVEGLDFQALFLGMKTYFDQYV
jgi:hypothetical protein